MIFKYNLLNLFILVTIIKTATLAQRHILKKLLIKLLLPKITKDRLQRLSCSEFPNNLISLNTTYAQHGLVNIAKKKRELKSFQNQLFEEILAHDKYK